MRTKDFLKRLSEVSKLQKELSKDSHILKAELIKELKKLTFDFINNLEAFDYQQFKQALSFLNDSSRNFSVKLIEPYDYRKMNTDYLNRYQEDVACDLEKKQKYINDYEKDIKKALTYMQKETYTKQRNILKDRAERLQNELYIVGKYSGKELLREV